jgi:hypothetical protein
MPFYMINKIVSKILSAGILAIIYGCYSHIMDVNKGQMGREAYLVSQAAGYDRDLAQPHSVVLYVIACLFMIGICLAAYELIALAITKILEKINSDPI